MSVEASITSVATDAFQYQRPEVLWTEEGSATSPRRRLMLEALTPYIERMAGGAVLDVGSGQGWLCAAVAEADGTPLGIEPSANNFEAARATYPGLAFEQTSLDDFETKQRFDAVTVVMASEHFGDAEVAFAKIGGLLKSTGRFLLLAADHDLFTRPRFDYTVEAEETGIPGETAVRTDYGNQAGVICDIVRTPERIVAAAHAAGFVLSVHHRLRPTPRLIEQVPKYEALVGQILFHLYAFDKAEKYMREPTIHQSARFNPGRLLTRLREKLSSNS